MPIINITVTARIIAGYLIALLLAIVILITGLVGINDIFSSFKNVTTRALPMTETASSMLSNQLQATIQLMAYQQTEKIKNLNDIEQRYTVLTEKNNALNKQLRGLAQDEKKISAELLLVENYQKKMRAASTQLMTYHRASLNSANVVREQREEFSDMGDEVVSYAADIESQAVSNSTQTLLSDITRILGKISSAALNSLDSPLIAAVKSVNKDNAADFNDVDNKFQLLERWGVFEGSNDYQNLKQSYNRFKEACIGANSLSLARIDQLEKIQQTNQQMQIIEAMGLDVVTALKNLAAEIHGTMTTISQQTEASVSSSKAQIISIAAVASVVIAVLAFLVTQSISKPLSSIVAAIKVVASGDLRQTFEIGRKDELRELSSAMQHLVTQLRAMLEEINLNSTQLSATAEETATISEQSFNSIARQKDQTNMIATGVEEMTATVEEVSRSINNTLERVEDAHNEVNIGTRLLSENIKSIRKLSADIDNSSTVIERLNEDTENVGTVLDVIRGVAEQTNLLALNAAIEAARAGEQGRGFAVVADEVRTLASRTQQSTQEIQDMIVRLQAGAREAVGSMKSSREEALNSVDGITKAGEMLTLVAEAIDIIKDMSHQISSAAEEQTVAAQEQNRNIVAIAAVSEETATGAQENQMASQELARMAETQLALINKFKV
ncbi:methyl-accepting chemotaxis protein [Oceanicoccus sp. KOV_DT_Chl]|uniref:methyl-accepting chemotaxis protein n=1 Tax=Oceanicoccus sp. KOV_DT_Chl TaxID=1904639 RepID=UPI000C7A23EB|nr:methyl-accepting chemotaxis protein [Oceanicoccus sp. KOV_DT_Chl]